MEKDQLDASNVSEMSESAPMEVDEEVKVEEATEAVSYTHLTLPTIYSV